MTSLKCVWNRRRVIFISIALLLLPIVFVLISDILYRNFGALDFPRYFSLNGMFIGFDASGRIMILSAFLLYSFVGISVFLYFLIDVFINYRDYFLAIYSVILVMAAILLCIIWVSTDAGSLDRVLGGSFYQNVLAASEIKLREMCNMHIPTKYPLCQKAVKSISYYSSIRIYINIASSIFSLVAISISLGSISCFSALFRHARRKNIMGRMELDCLSKITIESSKRLQIYLYMAGLFLSSGIVWLASWMFWPVRMIDQQVQSEYAAVINSSLLYFGVSYSLVIASIYIPAFALLNWRAGRLLRLLAQAKARRTPWFVGSKATIDTLSSLAVIDFKSLAGRFVALLLPLLSGALGGVVQFVF